MKKNILLYLIILFLSGNASGTAVSMGSGKTWLAICKGEDETLKEDGIGVCWSVVFSFMLGVINQSQGTGVAPFVCSYPNEGELPIDESLVKYLTENPTELDKGFMEILPRFFLSSGKKCDIKGRIINKK